MLRSRLRVYTKKQEQCSQTKPRWSGKRYMITYTAGRCTNCHRYGPLDMVCSSCKENDYLEGAPKYLPMSPPPKKRQKRAKVNPKSLESKQDTKAKLFAWRKEAAKEPFQQWLKNYCDVQKAHEHKRVQISVLFQSYSTFCLENDHERLMSLRSKNTRVEIHSKMS